MKLKEFMDAGILTQEEFDAKKKHFTRYLKRRKPLD
ncbi:SHOCT domain-containing protein [Lysinibacillus parviboronicapiens]|nr:SHOCT domain-containing protein [Lysinibacillus parviboronicapiens]